MGDLICRLLPYTEADGPAHMAADEALLEAAAGTASFRLYGWSEATVSLGYFQPAALLQSDALLAGRPFVRRPSGGAAILHHHELTYCLTLPAGADWQPRGQSWVCRMHGVIADALAGLGARTRPVACGEERKLGEVLCFLHQTPGDLLCEGHKVVGSAQRRQRGALMQHGSILIARSPFAPALPGLNELAGAALSPAVAADSILAALKQTLGWAFEEMAWPASVLDRAGALSYEKYTRDDWNRKR